MRIQLRFSSSTYTLSDIHTVLTRGCVSIHGDSYDDSDQDSACITLNEP